MQTIDALDMELLVNNSCSGSCIFQPRKGEASIGYGDRAVNLHNDHTGEEPDIIFVYLGCNDFAYFKDTFGTADSVDYETIILDNGDGTYTYAQPTNTCEAYAVMLHKVEHRYTNAEIYCMTSTARREVDYTGDTYPDAGQPTAYVAELQKVAKYFGYPVIDLENAIPKDIEIFDKYVGDKRAHANALGMDRITNEILSVMLDKESEIRHVTADHGAVAEQAVLLGGSYKAEVKIPWGYSIVVTMGGKDITIDAYKDGVIAITEVTGDIHVETVINRTPQNFRWEFRDGILTSIGASENALTKLSGIVANNILNDGIFQLNTPVVLKHDLPWAVEWKCAEDWRGVMLASQKESATKAVTFLTRTKGGQLCFGTYTGSQYDNYGIDLSDLNADTHTYRLENRIAADGSNMVWLYVDGEEIGPMNNYFIGSNDQNKTSHWVSGKDFVFSFIGMTGHALRNCQLDYLSVTECDHTYKNGICTGCGLHITDPEWEVGTIASADGLDNNTNTRLRTKNYLLLSEYEGLGINPGYTMTNFVYDENYTYLGTSSWLGSGIPFTTAELMEKYPTGVYFRVVFRTLDQKTLTKEDVAVSGVKFYLSGEEIPKPNLGFEYEDIARIGTWQDGAIWNGKLFVLDATGKGSVFDVKTGNKLNDFQLDQKNILKPHANSVCFGSTYYTEGDQYPLLYVNIYNNYANAEDRMEGTCCVYRMTESDGNFTTKLVQVIRIGFTEDLTLWKSKENNGDVRPYGNFVVDTDNHKLYTFVMRDASKSIRFFGFDIPELDEGIYMETYGCNLVELRVDDIKTQLDIDH
jgi:hypothetical protein